MPKKRASNEEKAEDPIKLALAAINQKWGDGSAMCLGANPKANVEVRSTGSIAIDHALGAGGLPKGRICEIYGPLSSGKTTFCLSCIAETQKDGGTAAFVDVEHALDPSYAKRLGVDINKLYFSQPQWGEQALDIVESYVRGGVNLIIVDSVAALVPKAELEGQAGDANVGQQARMMGQACRRLSPLISEKKAIVIFTNQVREKIGVMFGSPETTPGGRSLPFFASVRMDIRKTGQLKDASGTIYGNRTKIKIVKNKVAPPYTECEFDILYNEGISHIGSVIELGIEKGIIEKKGSWIAYNGEMLGQGAVVAKETLKGNPELLKEIEGKVMGALKE